MSIAQDIAKARRKTRRKALSKRILIILLLLFGVCFSGMAVKYVRSFLISLHTPVPTLFRATVNTRSLAFTAGESPDSAGIFNSDVTRVNIVLATETVFESEDSVGLADKGRHLHCTRNTTLDNVRLVRFDTSNNPNIALDTKSTGLLRYTITPERDAPDPSLYVSVDRSYPVTNLSCDLSTLASGEWRIRPIESSHFLDFSVKFLPAIGSRSHSMKMPSTAPAPEQNIALANPTNLVLLVDSEVVKPPNQLHLLPSGQTVNLVDGLNLKELRDASIEQLTFDPQQQSLGVTLVGSALGIGVRVGADEISVGETKYTQMRLHSSMNRLTFGATLLGAVATLLCAAAAFLSAWITYRNGRKSSTSE